MALQMDRSQLRNCPRCGNHCPVDALQCGKGRKYFGETDKGRDKDSGKSQDKDHGRKQGGCEDGLSGLLRRSGRFVRHAGLEEGELFQGLTGEEQAILRVLLEKLNAGWRDRYGEEALDRRHHRKHGDR